MPSLSFTNILAAITFTALSINASAIPPETSSSNLVPRDLKTCPALNNYVYTSKSGATQWKIGCDRDTESDGDHTVQNIQAKDLEDCIKICGDSNHHNWCKSVSWPGAVNEPGSCYLKGSNSGAHIERSGWKLAYKIEG